MLNNLDFFKNFDLIFFFRKTAQICKKEKINSVIKSFVKNLFIRKKIQKKVEKNELTDFFGNLVSEKLHKNFKKEDMYKKQLIIFIYIFSILLKWVIFSRLNMDLGRCGCENRRRHER